MKNPNKINLDVENVTPSEWDDIGDYFVKKDEIDIDSIHDEKGNITINNWNEVHADGELRDRLHEYWGSEGVKEIQDELRQEQEEADKLSAQLQDIYDAVEKGKGKIEKYPEIDSNGDPTGVEIERFIDDKGQVQNLNILKKRQNEHLDWVKHHENELFQGENDIFFELVRNQSIEKATQSAKENQKEANNIFNQLSGKEDGEISEKFKIHQIYNGKFGYKESLDLQREYIKQVFDKLDFSKSETERAERLRNNEDKDDAANIESTFEKTLESVESDLYYKEKMKEINADIDRSVKIFKKNKIEGETTEEFEERLRQEYIKASDERIELYREYNNPHFWQKVKNIFPPFKKKYDQKYNESLYFMDRDLRKKEGTIDVMRRGLRGQKFKNLPKTKAIDIAVKDGQGNPHTRQMIKISANEELLKILESYF